MAYGYDGLGRLAWSGPSNSNYPTTFYVYDGDLLLGEVTTTLNGTQVQTSVTAAYTWGAAGLVSEKLSPATNWPSSGTSLWYHFGPQGETRQLTNSSGNVVDTYVYTSWGEPGPVTGTDRNPFRYGGEFGYYTDPSATTGTILCGARWYYPSIGRWLSRDPIGYKGGPNLYEYCHVDPVDWIDPHGTDEGPQRTQYRIDMNEEGGPDMHIYHRGGETNIT